ncbi:hypothetical protein E1B28_004187 [Marasmius oreades]|uniref:YMC020W-like alpha/beta hydrolase domain-containing protein n=1 Tax=Marasmius oreades TaxID=181124 RepID=A0A9P8ACL9_9AGAR|nr:uncharacterized protein E1B28_004187 [Marasmius oreades]KAG7096777.1 hypothetical protein E1B28_004187 [Marasmius oreades]
MAERVERISLPSTPSYQVLLFSFLVSSDLLLTVVQSMSNTPPAESSQRSLPIESPSKPTASSAATPIAVPFPSGTRSTSRRSTRSASTYSTSSQQASRSNPSWRTLSISKGGQVQSGVSLVVAEPQLEGSGERQSEVALTVASSGKGPSKRSRLPSVFMKRRTSNLEDMYEENGRRESTRIPNEVDKDSNNNVPIALDPPAGQKEAKEMSSASITSKSQDNVDGRNDNGTKSNPGDSFNAISTDNDMNISSAPPPIEQQETRDTGKDAPISDPHNTPRPPSSAPSWFASFGRSRIKEANTNVSSSKEALKEDSVALTNVTTTKVEPSSLPTRTVISAIAPPHPSTTIPFPSNSEPTPLASRAQWPRLTSTSPSSPSPLHASSLPTDFSDDECELPPRLRRQETDLSAASTSSFPSSIDEECVPSLARTPDEEHNPLTGLNDSEGTVRARLSSLNPGSSRFSIALPLLGRQKVRREDIIARFDDRKTLTESVNVDFHNDTDNVSTEADASNISVGTATPDATPATADLSSRNPATTEFKSGIGAHVTASQWEGLPTTDTNNAPAAAAARHSWWDYIGWVDSNAPSSTADTRNANTKTEEPGTIHESQPTPKVNMETNIETKEPEPKVAEFVETGGDDTRKEDTADDRKTTIKLPQSPNKAVFTPGSSSGSWFGWGGTTSTSDSNSKAMSQSQPQTEILSEASSTSASATAPEQGPDSSSSLSPPGIVATLSNESQATIRPGAATQNLAKKPTSVFSSDTVGAKSGSWFAPWSWGATGSASNDATSGAGEAEGGASGQQTMTESEKVKEEALARQRELDEQREKERESEEREEKKRREREQASADSNPLNSAITSRYSSGWASIFGTVSKRTKMITENGEPVKRDGNGMEVMDLDLDENDGLGQEVAKVEEENVIAKHKDLERVKALDGSAGGGSKPASIKSAPVETSASSGEQKDKDDTKGKKRVKGAPPMITVSDDVRRESESLLSSSSQGNKSKKPSPTPSIKSAPPPITSSPTKISTSPHSPSSPHPPRPPNLVLPTWVDTFHTPPRSVIPPSARSVDDRGDGVVSRLGRVGKWLLGGDGGGSGSGRASTSERRNTSVHQPHRRSDGLAWEEWGKSFPRALDVLEGRGPPFEEPPLLKKLAWNVVGGREKESDGNPGEQMSHGIAGKGAGGVGKEGQSAEGHVGDVLRGCKNVVVIGIHGWFPGAVTRTMLGEPTGTSLKFVNMMVQAVEEFQNVHNVKLEKITKIPLEGEGTINQRVDKLYKSLLSNKEWMSDLHNADAIFVATHSQGSVVSTHLLDRLIRDRHIRTAKNAAGTEVLADLGVNMIPLKPQRVCCLALCGIHLGPLRYLSSSALVQPFIQYFESTAARELFEFQNTESEVSKSYVNALENVLYNGTKIVYVASMDDQVVPIYSGLFTSATHPLILRALYIDGDAYSSSDFLSNLLVLLLRVRNCGLPDSGLLAHLSDVTAGTLSGVGHSTAYEELSNYALAVNYLFLTNDGLEEHPKLHVEPFNANSEQNDYEIPWALRDLIADDREWHPKTTVLKDVKRKLQPIQRLPSTFFSTSVITTTTNPSSVSKL